MSANTEKRELRQRRHGFASDPRRESFFLRNRDPHSKQNSVHLIELGRSFDADRLPAVKRQKLPNIGLKGTDARLVTVKRHTLIVVLFRGHGATHSRHATSQSEPERQKILKTKLERRRRQ